MFPEISRLSVNRNLFKNTNFWKFSGASADGWPALRMDASAVVKFLWSERASADGWPALRMDASALVKISVIWKSTKYWVRMDWPALNSMRTQYAQTFLSEQAGIDENRLSTECGWSWPAVRISASAPKSFSAWKFILTASSAGGWPAVRMTASALGVF